MACLLPVFSIQLVTLLSVADVVWLVARPFFPFPGTLGQSTTGNCIVYGLQNTTTVQCFTSDPDALHIREPGEFQLEPHTPRPLNIVHHPSRVGTFQHLVHIVDVDVKRLVSAILVVAHVQAPVVTKEFLIELTRGKGASKRVPYLNPSGVPRSYRILTDQPDLVSLKSDTLEIQPGESEHICFRFKPAKRDFSLLVFVNVGGRTESCFAVRATVRKEKAVAFPEQQEADA